MRNSEFARSALTGHWAKPPSRLREVLRAYGWSLLIAGLFFVSLASQTLAEFREYNDEATTVRLQVAR
jgi:hypothetical protein